MFIADVLVTVLSAHVAPYPVGPDGWLFTGPTGDPPHQNTVGYWWRKTPRDAGLPGIKLHDPRHFFASGLIAEGCDVVTVQRALGHSKPTTTLNNYAHLWPTAADRTRKAAQSLIDAAILRCCAPHAGTVQRECCGEDRPVIGVGGLDVGPLAAGSGPDIRDNQR